MSSVDGIPSVKGSMAAAVPESASGFRDLVDAKVSFSRHATQRMHERRIDLSPQDMKLLHQAMGEAKASGAKQAAIVMGPGIFIVAPQNNTVITTVAKEAGSSMQVISNVDALVLVGRTSSEGASSPRPIDGGQPAPVHWSLMDSLEGQ